MALKTKLTKAEYDALPDALKAEYLERDGAFLLQTDAAAELIAARDREKARADTLQREKDEAEAARVASETAAAEEKARKAGDIAALEKSWEAKLATGIAAEKARADKLQKQLDGMIDLKAEAIAAEISVTPELLAPVIARRLTLDLSGDKAIVRVLDANGQPSAANFAELSKEYVDNPKYAPIIRGTNASGGSAEGNSSGGSAAGKKISDMTEAEQVALYNKDPNAYKVRARSEGIRVDG